jgi:hypothetical protein
MSDNGPTQRRIPDFFIVGHPKTGTTALYEMLRPHPEIFLPSLKEPEYLASDMRRLFESPIGGPVPATLDAYLELFADAPATQRAGEASAFYLSSTTAAAEIAKLNPEARAIAIFREPASFLRSLHLQLLQDHLEDVGDLRRALALEPRRREGRSMPRHSYRPGVLWYSEHVRYTDQLMRYHEALGRDRVLVLIYEEFRSRNEDAVRQILSFLGIDTNFGVTPVDANPTRRLRSHTLDRAVHRFSVGGDPMAGLVKAGIKSMLPRAARRRLLGAVQAKVVHAPPPAPDEALMDELRRRYRPEVERFSAYLDRDLLQIWGYDVGS